MDEEEELEEVEEEEIDVDGVEEVEGLVCTDTAGCGVRVDAPVPAAAVGCTPAYKACEPWCASEEEDEEEEEDDVKELTVCVGEGPAGRVAGVEVAIEGRAFQLGWEST